MSSIGTSCSIMFLFASVFHQFSELRGAMSEDFAHAKRRFQRRGHARTTGLDCLLKTSHSVWYWHVTWYCLILIDEVMIEALPKCIRWWFPAASERSSGVGGSLCRPLNWQVGNSGWREDGEPWAVGLYFLSQWDRVRLYTVYTHVTCKSYIILHHHLSTVSETFVCPVCRVVRWNVFFSAVSWGVRRFSQRDSQTTQRLQGIWMQDPARAITLWNRLIINNVHMDIYRYTIHIYYMYLLCIYLFIYMYHMINVEYNYILTSIKSSFCSLARGWFRCAMDDVTEKITIKVALVSGRCESISISKQCRVSVLTAAAKDALQIYSLTLSKAGNILNPEDSLVDLDVNDGDILMAIAEVPLLAATDFAFLCWSSSNGAVAWGNPNEGGDVSQVAGKLKDVEKAGPGDHGLLSEKTGADWPAIYGHFNGERDDKPINHEHFQTHILLSDLSVGGIYHSEAWTHVFHLIYDDICMLDMSTERLKRRHLEVQASNGAFAAILKDGSVVTWGNPVAGGDSREAGNVSKFPGKGNHFGV